MTALRNKHEEDESVDFDIISEAEDVSVVAALLKLYLRELPQALFVLSDKDRADYSRISDAGQRMMKLRHMVRMLPHANQATLRCIVEHLCRYVVVVKTSVILHTADFSAQQRRIAFGSEPHDDFFLGQNFRRHHVQHLYS